jgi:Holliday junction DNA helicase RuvB
MSLNPRPQFLNEFVGQKEIIKNLEVLIKAAKARKEPCDHILFYGPPGLGKTSLAKIVANEMGSAFHSTSGPALQKPGDLAAIITSFKKGDILFIDEIHRLNKMVEELLYPALEDFNLDVVLGKGPSAQILKISLNPFTLIGATTKIGLISDPLRSRFGAILKIDYYSKQDIIKILRNYSKWLKIEITAAALQEIALRSRFTPRIAQRLLKRVRDFAQVFGNNIITAKVVLKAFKSIGVDKWGLEKADRQLLNILHTKFNGGPVGIETIAKAFGEDQRTIEELYEPYLMRIGFLKRTKSGRVLTKKYQELLTQT